MFTQIKETCLYTRELDRAEAFYRDKLELPLISRVEGRHVFFRAGSSVLLIFNPDVTLQEAKLPRHAGYGPVHIAFEVSQADYDHCLSRLTDRGIAIINHQDWKGGFRSFYFHDPDGHVLEVVEKGMWEVG